MPDDVPLCAAPGPRGFVARVGTILLKVSLFVTLVLTLWKASRCCWR
jgi:hypothetical protein